MHKTICLIQSLLLIILLGAVIAVFAFSHSVAFAATDENTSSNEHTSGESIVDINTNYLQCSNLSLAYNENSQSPSAALKCNEDGAFDKTALPTVQYNLENEDIIEMFVWRTFWVAADYYTENGQPQGPKAFAIGEDGSVIDLPVKGYGLDAGKYTAEVDMSRVAANIELSGELSIEYRISPENQFGIGGMISVAILIMLLILSGVVIGCLIYLQKQDATRNKEKDEEVQKSNQELQIKLQDMEYINWLLKSEMQSIALERDEYKRASTASSENLIVLKRKLDKMIHQKETLKLQLGKNSPMLDNYEELERTAQNLREQVRSLLEENKKLKSKISQKPDVYQRPIEDYFPEIYDAYECAESCDYNPDNPEGSFNTQRQKIRDIMKMISIYRSQRR